MKPSTIIILLALSLAIRAEEEPVATIPEIPELAELIAIQVAVAPAVPEIKPPGDASMLVQTIQTPAIASPGTAGDPVVLAEAVKPPPIAAVAEATPPDLFTINLIFNWAKPHGQWMNQMLKDIEAARKAGDTETYTTLTTRYTAWAEKYLRKESPPQLDGNPGH